MWALPHGWWGLIAGVVVFAALIYMSWEPAPSSQSNGNGEGAGWTPPPKPEPQNFTRAELAKYDGKDGRPMYTACFGTVFDLGSHPDGPGFYGQDGAYKCFLGLDASLMFARVELDRGKADGDPNLTAMERDTMMDWYYKFLMKYYVVGYVTDGYFPKSLESEGVTPQAADAAAPVGSPPNTSGSRLKTD